MGLSSIWLLYRHSWQSPTWCKCGLLALAFLHFSSFYYSSHYCLPANHTFNPNSQYTSCKHAIIGLTKTAGRLFIHFLLPSRTLYLFASSEKKTPIDSIKALDNAPLGIRVNCVCPTWTDTPMTRRATEVAPGLEQALLATIPLGRLGRPEEAADAVIFLCSPRASFTTGTGMVLDGGMTLSC